MENNNQSLIFDIKKEFKNATYLSDKYYINAIYEEVT